MRSMPRPKSKSEACVAGVIDPGASALGELSMVDTESSRLDEVLKLSSIGELVAVPFIDATGLREIGCSFVWEEVVVVG